MYQTILVEKLIEDGAKLLKALDQHGVPAKAVLWFHDPDKTTWKLVIATPLAGVPGPREAYSQIQSAMTGINLSFFLDDITVMNPDSQKFAEFKRRMEGVVPSSALQPKDSPVVFDDAYIYRWPD